MQMILQNWNGLKKKKPAETNNLVIIHNNLIIYIDW